MKNYKEEIGDAIKEAMKSGDSVKKSVLSMLKAALLNEEIAKKKREEGLSEEEFVVIVGKEIKKRKEAIEQMSQNKELVESETAEMKVLEVYMPEQMSEDDLRIVVKEVMSGGQTEMGPLIGAVMAKVKGQADGNLVRKIVEDEISKS
jgi:uncharacterized protein YqeY